MATPSIEATDFVDDFLRLVAYVRAEKARDPLRRLEDVLLDLRLKPAMVE